MDQIQRSTILIVDDNPEVIEALTHDFRKRNYEPVATADPTVVMQKLRAVKVDLLVLDLKMSTMDGFQVLDLIRKEGIQVPTIIITGFAPEYRDQLKQRNIPREDIVMKPFGDYSEMEAAINRKLGKRPPAMPEEVGNEYEDPIYLENECKVVIVDDETEIIDMLREPLEQRNYQVHAFTRGDQALEAILAGDYHVAIIDLKVPGISGDELIQKLLVQKPSLKVILVTAFYPNEIRNRLQKAGIDLSQLMTKPFNLPLLIERVKTLAIQAGVLSGKV